jgi:hypothetical protein
MSETPEDQAREALEDSLAQKGLKCRLCSESISTPEDLEAYRQNMICSKCAYRDRERE